MAECGREGDVRAATLALLAARAPEATVCPSEVARVVAVGGDWRAAMPAVHAAIDVMLTDGAVRLSWRGVGLPVREGPYRIGQGGVLPTGAADHEGEVD